MEIEWVTLCEAATAGAEPDRLDIIGVNAAGVDVENEPPVDVPVNVALCLLAAPEEVAAGGVIQLACGVFAPDGTPTGYGTNVVWVYEEGGRPPHPGLPARHVVPINFGFTAQTEGIYVVGVQIRGQAAHFLPYAVRRYVPDAS